MKNDDIRFLRLDFANLARRRRQLHVNQSELGRIVGCSPSAISRYENGSRMPSAQRWVQLAIAMGTPLWDLTTTVEPKETQ